MLLISSMKRWRSRAATFVVDQILLQLSERLPVLMAPAMARAMGLPSVYGPPLEPRKFVTAHEFLSRHCPNPPAGSVALDLGCGRKPQNPFAAEQLFGVDLIAIPDLNIQSADLNNEPLPFCNEQFHFVTAHDLFEHIPRVSIAPSGTRFPFIDLMNEVDRVLIRGGYLFSQTPAYPASEAFQDPTHVNFITTETFSFYFCVNNPQRSAYANAYGFHGAFDLIAQGWSDYWLFTLMRKL